MVVAGPSFLFIHEIFNNRYNELEEKACMKKLFIILILFFVSGCSNIKTKDEYKDGITISSMNEIPDITELVDLKADIDAKAMVDGNKRLGTHVMLVFLALNGYELSYTQKELSDIILDLASGKIGAEDILQWIISHQK